MTISSGYFIVFEGGEGSGKTKHATLLAERLRVDGRQVVLTHEPGGSDLGVAIRKIILDAGVNTPVPRAELLLFLADRCQHVETVIRPALERGDIVICDRFSGSTFAYQLGGRQLPDEPAVRDMDAYARGGIEPDIVFFLDMPVERAFERKRQGNNEFNRMDNEDRAFHERVAEYFRGLAQRDPQWVSITTEGPREQNAEQIYAMCRERLGL